MPVTLTPDSSHGSLNGVTAVTIVAAPAANTTRTVRSIRFANIDTAVVTIRVRKTVAGTPFEFDSVIGLAVDGKFNPIDGAGVFILSSTTQSITALMAGAPATINPTFTASWIDRLVS